MANFKKAATKSEIPDQAGKCVEIEGKRIALFNVGGQFFAIDDTCTHRGGSLSAGAIDGDQVVCPLHSACFNLRTGEVVSPPAAEEVATYQVCIVGDDVELEL